MSCPCGSKRPYEQCCGPLLDGRAHAATAEALMRSRYTAFVRGAADYLVDTYDASTRDPRERDAIEKWSRESTWLGLEIVATERGGEGDDEGVVEFRAKYRQGGPGQAVRVHHERSRFRRREGRWYYLDGEGVKAQPAAKAPSVGRNDPCPCGSGKKYKKCHG